MKARVVSFHYTLTNDGGETLDSSKGQEPMSYLEGGGQIIPGLETEIQKLKVGDKKKIKVEAAQAYGPYNESLVVQLPRAQLPHPDKVKIGDQFSAGAAAGPSGDDSAVFTATKISDSHVTLDGNHPLAGQDLTFEVEITEAREATAEELSHGHAHGGDGHHHH